MFRSVIFVSVYLMCASANANEPPKNPANDVKPSAAGKVIPPANAGIGLEANAGTPQLPLGRARIFSFYAPTDEAPEIASLRTDGSLHLSPGVTLEEAADVAASQLKIEHSDLCKFAAAPGLKQAYTVVINGQNMSWSVGLTVEGGVEFQKPNLTYREITFFHLLASRLACSTTQASQTK
jgi:hypothetical protein